MAEEQEQQEQPTYGEENGQYYTWVPGEQPVYYQNQGEMENAYNQIMGAGAGSTGQTGANTNQNANAAYMAQMQAMLAAMNQPVRLPTPQFSMPSLPTVGGMAQLDPQIQLLAQELGRLQLKQQGRIAAMQAAQQQVAQRQALDMARGVIRGGWWSDPYEQAWISARRRLG